MRHDDEADGKNEREWKQTMTAFWDLFEHGTLQTIKQCNCGHNSSKEDTFHTLFLGFHDKFHGVVDKNDKSCALSDMISYYLSKSQVNYECTVCSKRIGNATTHGVITQYPKILYIVLQRGNQTESTRKLIETHVDFPLEQFNPFKSSGQIDNTNRDVRYDLVASIYRKAKTLEEGHFYAICKDVMSGYWHKYDDNTTEVVSLQKANGTMYVCRTPILSWWHERG
jgi:uncharacterized UBP type Zn finger protein